MKHLLLLASALVVSPLPAQEPAAPAQGRDMLFLYVAEAESFFRHPKDRGLLEALRLIDDRVLELPDEIPGFPPVPPEAIQLATRLLVGEKSLRIGIVSEPDPALPNPLYGQVTLMENDPQAAVRMYEAVVGMLAMMGAPVEPVGEEGLTSALAIPAPVPVRFGARGEDFVFSVGQAVDAPLDLSGTRLPGGITPSLVLHLDFGALIELTTLLAGMDDMQETQQLVDFYTSLGFSRMVIDVAYGSDRERSYTVTRMPGYADVVRNMGTMPARALGSADLRLVPKDATWAVVGACNVRGTVDMFLGLVEDELAEAGMGDPVEMWQGMTGFHLYEDVVDNFGSAWGIYASDTTGGGGLLSIVAFVELSDAERWGTTQARIEDMVDGIGEMEARGYVRVRRWAQRGARYSSLTFPGLPVPFEPTLATTDTHLFVGATPQAALAAVAQATGRGESLLDNQRFREQLAGDPEGAMGVSFFDSPRLLREGYGLTSLLTSALVNGTRSRAGDRDAGMVMPSYHELMRGAKASVAVTRFVEGDYVQEARGDGSILVNVTSFVGLVGSTPLLLALPVLFASGARFEPTMMEEVIEAEIVDDDEDF